MNDAERSERTPPEQLTRLREQILARCDLEEFRTLCTDLGVHYDDLRGEGLPARARELVAYLDRKGRLTELQDILAHPRPARVTLPSPQPNSGSSDALAGSRVDVLLVTVTDVEARAVLGLARDKLDREPAPHFIGHKTYYDLGTLGGARTLMVRSEMGSEGPSGSTLTISEAIDRLAPAAVIMVGIAFGVDDEKQNLGDVLVSKQLLGYELQRVGKSSKRPKPEIVMRGDRVSASPRLLDRFRDGELSWEGPKVRFGLILSGQKLIDNIDFRDQLRRLEPEAIGGEMEGVGLYAAAHLRKVDWILVKAICDWADGQKRVDKDERQKEAACNAARFVFHVVERGGLAQARLTSGASATPAIEQVAAGHSHISRSGPEIHGGAGGITQTALDNSTISDSAPRIL